MGERDFIGSLRISWDANARWRSAKTNWSRCTGNLNPQNRKRLRCYILPMIVVKQKIDIVAGILDFPTNFADIILLGYLRSGVYFCRYERQLPFAKYWGQSALEEPPGSTGGGGVPRCVPQSVP